MPKNLAGTGSDVQNIAKPRDIKLLGLLTNANIFWRRILKEYKPLSPLPQSPPPTMTSEPSDPSLPQQPNQGQISLTAPPVAIPKTTPPPEIVPVLKYIVDESLFDSENLTCKACAKTFKNHRAFKLHKDRHQGTLNHKCPDCVRTFNGRSEVIRHMTAMHNRTLRPGENTYQDIRVVKAKNAALTAESGENKPFLDVPLVFLMSI